MTEGLVKIYMSVKEPEDKNLLWLRPYLNHDGYELLYCGSKGWTPLIVPRVEGPCIHKVPCDKSINNTIICQD